jgi:peptidylamidoglycolate lyase
VSSWGANTFWMPHGLRTDRDDNIWVTDIGLHQVMKFSHDGNLLMTVGVKGEPGLDRKHFDKPTDIAFAPDGSVYVSDGYGNSRVVKLSAKGEFLLDWGRKGSKPGEFDLPHGISTDSEGRVYVADRSNARVQVFKGDGTFLHEWKSAELGRPWAVTVGPDGNVYVVDGGDLKPRPPDRCHILKLDQQGQILDKWASHGNYDGQVYWGHAIAVGKDGAVYVGDILGMRAQKFSKTGPNR